MRQNLLVLASRIFTVLLLVSAFFVNATTSITGSDVGVTGLWPYNPWWDVNDDGKIDIQDLARVSGAFGTYGDPLAKASLDYDSGWIDITDKCGQYFNVTHNLNSTDIIVDITGKTTADSGVHQRHLGGTGYAQGWNQTYGGENNEEACSVIQTYDGGYAITGPTISFGAGNEDFWLVKTDASGNMQWNKTYGGELDDESRCVVQTSDGGYTIAGFTSSFGAGSSDFFLVKTDSDGNIAWNRTYGGADNDMGESMTLTSDGGYAIAGYTTSFDIGGGDFWLVKTDADGNMQWNKTYGGLDSDIANYVIQTNDGGFAIVGSTISFGAGGYAFWLVKTDAAGNMQWNQTYGGLDTDIATTVIQTFDGGYAITGLTSALTKARMVKTDINGNMEWSKIYEGQGPSWALSLVQTSDGGYTIVGSTGSSESDVWLFKTDATGNIQWSKTYERGNDIGWSLTQTDDGGYAIAAWTMLGAGDSDFWLIKTDPCGNTSPYFEYGLAWTDSTSNTITLYRGANDAHWNYVRVRIWKIKETP